MNVITFDNHKLAMSTLQLWSKAKDDFSPDYVVAIERGGGVLADILLNEEAVPPSKVIRIKSQRELTQTKDRFFSLLLQYFPNWLNLTLRKLEAYSKECFTVFSKANQSRHVSLLGDIDLSVINGKKVLVIDDAIDSGDTIVSCIQFIEKHSAPSELKVASITVTFSNPRIFPDYSLFKRTIVRFPWAPDVKS